MYRESALAALLLCLSTSVNAASIPSWKRDGYQLKSTVAPAVAFHPPTPLEVTSNYLPVQQSGKSSKHFPMLKALQHNGGILAKGTSAPSEQLTPADGGQEYLVQIEWNGTPVLAILDTGSSDTWLIQENFTCTDANGKSQPESTCSFGPVFNGTFSGGSIANENFNISYGDGEFVTGLMGYESVTVAGITVPKQEVALGNSAYWNGDGVSSGLIGFAYPSLTSAFAGTNPQQDSQADHYNPIFTTMYQENLVSPMFSLALERGNGGGYLALGGLPPVNFTQTFTSTPIQVLSLSGFPANTNTFYAIDVASYKYGSKTATGGQAIVDSGTTLIYLPTTVAKEINAAFKPAAKLLSSEGAYFVKCTATPPAFSVNINGTAFAINPADLIYQNIKDPKTGYCLTGIQDGGSGPYILGDVFLQNVVAVFDVGAAEMRFAPHTTY